MVCGFHIYFLDNNAFWRKFNAHGCKSYGVPWVDRRCRGIVGVYISGIGYLQIDLMDLGRISHGLHASLYIPPNFSFNDNCSATPSGTTPAFLIWRKKSMARVISQPYSASLPIDLYKYYALMFDLADLIFPIRIIKSRSYFLVASSIGNRWYLEPFWIMSIIFPSYSLWLNSLAILVGSWYYEP